MLSAKCISCLVARQYKLIKDFDDEVKKAEYMKEVLETLSNMGEGEASPVATERMDRRFTEYFGVNRSFEGVKKKYNELLLAKEGELASAVDSSSDRLLTALKLSMIGNYIDFGALASVEEEKLTELIRRAPENEIDMVTYEKFVADLKSAKRLIFIPDNCGEIVFDKIFLRVLREEYPSLDVKAMVRGRPVLNDVTRSDAEDVGIDKICPIVDTGNGIAGCYYPALSDEARRLVEEADVIVAKGQGNFETMFGCDRNVYYVFLCKCEWFEMRFGMKHLEGVFVNELDKKFTVKGSAL